MSTTPPPSAGDSVGMLYGGDEAGLICGYLFHGSPGAPVRALGSAEAATWLAQAAEAHDADVPATAAAVEADADADPEAPIPFLWLHFNLSNAHAQRWLERHAALPESFYEGLKQGSHSTRIERDEDTLIAVINDVHFDFSFDGSDIATLWISVGPYLVVTARGKPLRSVDALRTAMRQGHAPRSSTALLEQLMRKQADALVDIVRGVTARIDAVEDELLLGRLHPKRARLGALRRLLVRLQRLLAPEPAALFRLLQRPPAWMAEVDVQELREATEEFSVVLRDMTSLQERTKLLQEEIAANVNEDNNRSLFVLTVVTVLALPINIIAGLFGMNVGGVPLAEHHHGFWIVVSIVVIFTCVAGFLAFRKNDQDRD